MTLTRSASATDAIAAAAVPTVVAVVGAAAIAVAFVTILVNARTSRTVVTNKLLRQSFPAAADRLRATRAPR